MSASYHPEEKYEDYYMEGREICFEWKDAGKPLIDRTNGFNIIVIHPEWFNNDNTMSVKLQFRKSYREWIRGWDATYYM